MAQNLGLGFFRGKFSRLEEAMVVMVVKGNVGGGLLWRYSCFAQIIELNPLYHQLKWIRHNGVIAEVFLLSAMRVTCFE